MSDPEETVLARCRPPTGPEIVATEADLRRWKLGMPLDHRKAAISAGLPWDACTQSRSPRSDRNRPPCPLITITRPYSVLYEDFMEWIEASKSAGKPKEEPVSTVRQKARKNG